MITPEQLEGRIAKCYCGNSRPSTEAIDGRLAFFEYRGPGTEDNWNHPCKHCGYYRSAHDPVAMARNVPSNRRTIVEQGKCPGYEPRGPAAHDTYYCGCRGWD